MNYESMSDFEINNKVRDALVSNHATETEFDRVLLASLKRSNLSYCENINYVWPIIIENKITIVDLGNEYMAVHGFQLSDDQYRDNVADWSLEARDKNPLRAAMIVFLMMNEG